MPDNRLNKMTQKEKFKDLKTLGEQKAIDFINTVDWRGREHPKEYINNYIDLIDWAEHRELLDQTRAAAINEKASNNPDAASEIHQRTIAFREAAYRTFFKLFINDNPDTDDKSLIETEMRKMYSQTRLDLQEKRLELSDEMNLDLVLNIIVKETVELLTSDDVNRVKRCRNEECGWLFFDISKNNSRKWCRMESCGNRAKARRHYSRSKK